VNRVDLAGTVASAPERRRTPAGTPVLQFRLLVEPSPHDPAVTGCLVTVVAFGEDAAAPPVAEMRLRTLVNGDVRQDASCGQMITGVPELIAYISAGITLEPGDIIATGTPSGVALGMNPPAYLEPGDKVSIEITGIGELVNTVAGPR